MARNKWRGVSNYYPATKANQSNLANSTQSESGVVQVTDFTGGYSETLRGDFHESTEYGSLLTDGRKPRVRHITASNSLKTYSVKDCDEMIFIDLSATGVPFTITLPALPATLAADSFSQKAGGTFKPGGATYDLMRTWGRRIEILDIAAKSATRKIYVKSSTGTYIGQLSTNGGKLVLQSFCNPANGAWHWAEIGCCGGEPYGYGGPSYPEVFQLV